MKLLDFYNNAVKLGRQRDPRGLNYKGGYEDTAILCGSKDKNIKKIMVGIDIEVPEILLADRVREREGLDLVVSHHPEGTGIANLYKVMQLQVDVLSKIGVSRKLAQELLNERMWEVERRILPQNSMRSVNAAEILNMAFMCLHTPADNHVFHFIQRLMSQKKPTRVQDIIDILREIPEYQEASKNSCGPRLLLGNLKAKTGKILPEMTGGTEGHREVFERLKKAGVGTIICMHLSEEHLKKVKEINLNVIIAGHISSDTLGLNLLLDRLEHKAKERFETIECSGFKRIRRSTHRKLIG